MPITFNDENNVSCFRDQNALTEFVDQLGNVMTCGGVATTFGGFSGKSRIRITKEDYNGKVPIGSGFCGEPQEI